MSRSTFAEYYNQKISYNHRKVINTERYRLEPQTHDAFEMIYVIIFDTGIIFDNVYKSLPDDIHVIDCRRLPFIFELFEKMDFYCNHYNSAALENILSHLTDEIFYNITLAEKTTKPFQYTVNPLFARLIEYIDSHLSEPLTLDMICKELYISKSNLHKIFEQHLNITPKRYIRLKRLNLAQKMLRQGLAATNVYETCGFSDYSSFYRNYVKEFGYAPSDETNRNVIRTITD